MYYLKLIQKFWNFNQKAKLDANVITVYFYLLNFANDCGSYTVSISDRNLSKTLGLSRNTIMAARKKLQSLGIIHYNKDTDGAATYRILIDYDAVASKPETIQLDTILLDLVVPQNEESIVSSPTSLTSLVSECEQKEPEQHELNDEDTAEPTVKGTGQPSLDTFLQYAQTLEGYEPSLDQKITEKYSSWEMNNWKSVSGRPITDWKSSLKNLMPFMKNTADKDLSLDSISRIKRPK
ncbi:hypothetical protein SAMN05421856_11021 [Chryseobacterium taichungense]|uniref:Helix-turn-helix domain-containing protein n=1 Tax=Chryseobacterium taichungense TaxID=295069 RepID=A0A1H8CMT7_9FLAO|nr:MULTISPECIES: helix-turn-helix domain-containing protein [Chryseobacterium]MCT4319260.1 hypothetical protein [Elizabethkingia anophelis]UMQ40546.1 helix-turn-helix domain-containing protein [Chryseobacterium sp. Y16C]SEM96453.1 hypothetical protein SAMN05421856_11021 [Chryseobacterium taichungense]